MRVHPLSDRDKIRAYLELDRRWAAYALADLDPEQFKLSEWYGVEDEDGLRALALIYKGFEPPALVTLGDAAGITLMLGAAVRPPRVYLNVRDEHMPAIRTHYRIASHVPMWRMTLDPRAFRPVHGHVTALTPQYTKHLEELYALGGGDAFTPSQVYDGAFFGIEERGLLIAAAGTHVLSEAHSVAAVGNVYTHPNHRRRGYAQRVTSGVCAHLIQRGIRTIALNVAQSNSIAIHVYEKLGFKKYLPFNEGVAVRKAIK